MTTPREDAIAALLDWATIVVASYRRGDLPVGEIDSLDEALAALGAEAETPDHAFEPMRDANDPTCSRRWWLRRNSPGWHVENAAFDARLILVAMRETGR